MNNLPAGDNTTSLATHQEGGTIRIRRPGGIDIGLLCTETLCTASAHENGGFVQRSLLVSTAILAGFVVPKTGMVFPGRKDEHKRQNFIACLEQSSEDGSRRN